MLQRESAVRYANPADSDLSSNESANGYHTWTRMREQASGMRQLAGKKTRYRRADAAPLAGLISGSAAYKATGEIQSTSQSKTSLTAEREEHNVLITLRVMEFSSGMVNPFPPLA